MVKIIFKTIYPAFYLAVFFLMLPPVYILLSTNPLLTSDSIARYLLLLVLILLLGMSYINKLNLTINKESGIIILLYFFSQSLSVVAAKNPSAFFLAYKDLIVGVIIYFISYNLIKSSHEIKNLIKVFIGATIVFIVFQAISYFDFNYLQAIFRDVLYSKYLDVFVLNFQRNRFFVDSYIASIIPFFIFYIYDKKEKRFSLKLLFFAIISAIWLLAILSNFRAQLAVAFFATIVSFLLFKAKRKMRDIFKLVLAMTLFIFIGFFFVSSRVSNSTNSSSETSLTRLLTPNTEDVSNLITRINFWKESVDMAYSSPIVGVGLGNYYDNLINLHPKNKLDEVTLTNPHNIFFASLAETGLFGLFALSLLIVYFIKMDAAILFKFNFDIISVFIVSFWSLFLFALVYPPVTLTYICEFWILRAIIDRFKI